MKLVIFNFSGLQPGQEQLAQFKKAAIEEFDRIGEKVAVFVMHGSQLPDVKVIDTEAKSGN